MNSVTAVLLVKRTRQSPQKRHDRSASDRVQCGAGAEDRSAGGAEDRKVSAAGHSRSSQSVAGTNQHTTAAASTRNAQRQPSSSMRNWQVGIRSAIPMLMPAVAIPTAVPMRV